MTQVSETLVRGILDRVIDPHSGQPLSASIRAVGVDGDRVSVDIQLGYPPPGYVEQAAAEAKAALEAESAIAVAAVSVSWRVHAHKVQGQLAPLPGVKNVIAVASGEGGGGKCTLSVNLALGQVAEGATVGILDANSYGPSQPRILGLSGKPSSPDG